MRRVGVVVYMGERRGEGHSEIWWKKLKERGHLGNLVINERKV